MSNFNDLSKLALEAEQVFLPNRYPEPFVEAFQNLTGLEVPETYGRQMSVQSSGKTFRWIRGRNIPSVVSLVSKEMPGVKTVGLTGSDWCMEYDCATLADKKVVLWGRALEKSYGRIALIAPARLDGTEIKQRSASHFSLLPVVTGYPNFVGALTAADRCNLSVLEKLDGGVEGVADALGLAAVDLVCSEATIKTNNFVEIEKLADVYPVLVAPKESA